MPSEIMSGSADGSAKGTQSVVEEEGPCTCPYGQNITYVAKQSAEYLHKKSDKAIAKCHGGTGMKKEKQKEKQNVHCLEAP